MVGMCQVILLPFPAYKKGGPLSVFFHLTHLVLGNASTCQSLVCWLKMGQQKSMETWLRARRTLIMPPHPDHATNCLLSSHSSRFMWRMVEGAHDRPKLLKTDAVLTKCTTSWLKAASRMASSPSSSPKLPDAGG